MKHILHISVKEKPDDEIVCVLLWVGAMENPEKIAPMYSQMIDWAQAHYG